MGMKVKITMDRKDIIDMSNHVQKFSDDFSEELKGTVSSPIICILLDMNKKVHSDGYDEFHSAAAKLRCIRNKLSDISHSKSTSTR